MGVTEKLLARIRNLESENTRLNEEADWLALQLADNSLTVGVPCGVDCNPCEFACRQEQWREAARKAAGAS